MVAEHGDQAFIGKLKNGLSDVTIPDHFRNIIGLMVGLHGKKEDAPILLNRLKQEMLDEFTRYADRLLLGYILLEKDAGWKYALTLTDPAKPFAQRYDVVRVIKHFWDVEPGLIAKEELLKVLEKYLGQPDMADLTIEDLRRWKQWGYTKRILELSTQKDFDNQIISRAIMRYMLSVPNDPQTREYVTRLRQNNPQQVAVAEEILELEKEGSKVKK